MSIKGYKFRYRPVTDPASDWIKANDIPQANPDYTYEGLASGTEYELAAQAIDMASNESEWSTGLVVTTDVHDPSEDPMSAADEAVIDEIITRKMAAGSWSGAGCLTYITGPTGYYRKARGSAVGRALTLDDKMRFGSITKMATATLILAQVDAGHLSLDDTIDQFVPGITYGDRITMRMLLMMRSGIKDYLQQDQAVQINYMLHPTATCNPLALFKAYPPLHLPDAITDYSNSNYILLGMVLESLDATYGTSRPVSQILIEDFCQAVGMTQTEWPTGNLMTPPYARGWADNPAWATMVQTVNSLPLAWLLGAIYWALVPALSGGWPAVPNFEFTAASPTWAGAAGVLDGTIDDLVTFGKALQTGALLSPEMKQLREEVYRTYIAYAPTHPREGDGWSGAGLGTMQFGQWCGWVGNFCGYMSIMFYNIVNGAVIAVMGNYYPFPVLEMFYELRYALWPDSTATLPRVQRMTTPFSDSDLFGTGSLWNWHAVGDADGDADLPHKVPFYL